MRIVFATMFKKSIDYFPSRLDRVHQSIFQLPMGVNTPSQTPSCLLKVVLLLLAVSNLSVVAAHAASSPAFSHELGGINREAAEGGNSRTIQQKPVSVRQKEAMAFLLGWNSKTILLQTTAEDRKKMLLSIRRYAQVLNVTLPHAVSFYFVESDRNDGTRAQAFAEETYAELKMSNLNVANHFGAATNLLLKLSRKDDVSITNSDTQEMIEILDMPAHLKRIPDHNLLDWAVQIHDYFMESLR